jgi:hypothetical protein
MDVFDTIGKVDMSVDVDVTRLDPYQRQLIQYGGITASAFLDRVGGIAEGIAVRVGPGITAPVIAADVRGSR